ncbi:hypothetical protein [Kitasatospora sp. NPDC086791]|uniref:hypothetical protein n=1 Tax=Kitasatospora sp. NPDC086791 TaxID=3155178 RepID=UPI00341F42F0
MPTTSTYTETRTRTESVLDQFEIFLRYTGVSKKIRTGFLRGIENRWLAAIGVFLVNGDGLRILEAEISVDWTLHSDLGALMPTVRTDLPGWEGGAAPEITVIGNRFGRKAQELNLTPRAWARFTSAIIADGKRHADLCGQVGVVFRGAPPGWASSPEERSYTVQDLNEVATTLRQA